MDIRSGSKSVTFKAVVVGAIVLLLMVPLSFLRDLVSERAGLREEAFARVAEGWGGDVTIGGPMIVIPTERTVTDKEGTRVVRSEIYLLPVLAAVALVLVNAIYVAGALRSPRRGVAVGVAMSVVYGLLYVLVLSEDYALLLGAITLFTALAAVMLVTRKLDWYRLGTAS
jgi:inner membrane protein involved in colicin E2 resistance